MNRPLFCRLAAMCVHLLLCRGSFPATSCCRRPTRSMLFVGLSACGLADRPFLRTRKELLRGALAGGAAAFASRSADAAALPWERDVVANPLQARFVEQLRI